MQNQYPPINPLDIRIRLWVGIIGACAVLVAFVLGLKLGASGISSMNPSEPLGRPITASCSEPFLGTPITPAPFFQEKEEKNDEEPLKEEIIIPEVKIDDRDTEQL